MNKWESVKLIQYFCGRLDFIRIFHLHKLQFIARISTSGSGLVMKQCVNYCMLSHEFRDMLSMYTLYCTKAHVVLFEMLFMISLLLFAALICDGLSDMLVLTTLL